MLTIKALGKEYTLKNDGEDQDLLDKAAQSFQLIVTQLETSFPQISREKLFLLAGLELAQIHLKDGQTHTEQLDSWSLKLNNIRSVLEEHKVLTLEREVGLSS